jgi:hypothetical protein
MHLLSRCSALGPGPGSLPRPSSSPSSRTRPCALFAPAHLVPYGTAWHSGGGAGGTQEGSGCTSGGAFFCLFFWRDHKKKIEGNTTAFLIPRTTLRGFFCILTTPWRKNSALEGLLRPEALASIGLSPMPMPTPTQPHAAPCTAGVFRSDPRPQGHVICVPP